MTDCPHCGLSFTGEAHGCPESRPKPNLADRLREDHRDTIECEHGFTLHRDPCPNAICLARDLADAAERIEQARAVVADLLTLNFEAESFGGHMAIDNAVAFASQMGRLKCPKCDGCGIYEHDLPGGMNEPRRCPRCGGGGQLRERP
jgi:hypothetical protein